jgi:hypothetical protein
LSFYPNPGPIDDLKELAVGAESKGLSIRVAMRNDTAKGFPLLYTTTEAFLAFVAYSESGRDAFLNSNFVIA